MRSGQADVRLRRRRVSKQERRQQVGIVQRQLVFPFRRQFLHITFAADAPGQLYPVGELIVEHHIGAVQQPGAGIVGGVVRNIGVQDSVLINIRRRQQRAITRVFGFINLDTGNGCGRKTQRIHLHRTVAVVILGPEFQFLRLSMPGELLVQVNQCTIDIFMQEGIYAANLRRVGRILVIELDKVTVGIASGCAVREDTLIRLPFVGEPVRGIPVDRPSLVQIVQPSSTELARPLAPASEFWLL